MRIATIVLMMTTILCALPAAAQDDPVGWIDRDRIRAAYFYANPPADAHMQQLVDAGMNAIILKATRRGCTRACTASWR